MPLFVPPLGLTQLLALGVRFWYPEAVIGMAPRGYWRLGEPSGTTATDAMGVNNGTYVATPTLGVAGLLTGDLDTAVTFASASSEYVALGTSSTLEVDKDVTVAAWFKAASAPAGFQAIVGRQDGAKHGYRMSVDSAGKLNGFIGGGSDWVGNAVISAASVCDNIKHFLVMTRANGGDLLGYVDGAYVGSSAAVAFVLSMAGSANASIGAFEDGGSQYLDGTVDEPAIWDRALSAAEIAALYRIGR